MLRTYVKLLKSEMKLRVMNIDVLLIKINIPDGRWLILHYVGILSFFQGGHLEYHPK